MKPHNSGRYCDFGSCTLWQIESLANTVAARLWSILRGYPPGLILRKFA